MKKIAFLFSGQGAQKPGMMRNVYESSEEARRVFRTADHMLGRSITDICFTGIPEELNLTHNTQPCMLAAELAAFAALTAHGVFPDVVAGFSLGEYAALTAAGVFEIADAFRIIQARADAMQAAVPEGKGAMAAVMKQDAETVNDLCNQIGGFVVPANYNCPGQIVVSGEAAAVDKLLALARTRKICAIKLPVSVPSHCDLMRPATLRLESELRMASLHTPKIPCYANIDARPYTDDTDVVEQLCRQIISPVLWEETLRNLYAANARIFVEVGPGSTLTSFVKKTLPDDAIALNIELFSTINDLAAEIKNHI